MEGDWGISRFSTTFRPLHNPLFCAFLEIENTYPCLVNIRFGSPNYNHGAGKRTPSSFLNLAEAAQERRFLDYEFSCFFSLAWCVLSYSSKSTHSLWILLLLSPNPVSSLKASVNNVYGHNTSTASHGGEKETMMERRRRLSFGVRRRIGVRHGNGPITIMILMGNLF